MLLRKITNFMPPPSPLQKQKTGSVLSSMHEKENNPRTTVVVDFLCLTINLFLHWFCSVLEVPYDCSAEADLLHSLIVKARFENNRFQKPRKQPETSSIHVDWFWYWNTQYIRIEIFTFRFCVLLRTQNSALNMWDFLISFNCTSQLLEWCVPYFLEWHEGLYSFMIILYMYLTFSLSSVQEYFVKPIRVRLCIPGLEVPEWFCYKNTGGSSLNIPAHWHRTTNTDQFLGFTFCAVISFGHSKKKRPVNIRCECHLITQGGNQSDLKIYYHEEVERKERSLSERDHVFIWSINSSCFFKEASFHFKPLGGTADVVVKCGVHPLFVQDCWWILCYFTS